MFFKPGDLVIKNTGGNKMTIISCDNNKIECGWFTEKYHESTFEKNDLIPFSQYERVIKVEKRNDLIGQILKS